MKIAYELNGFLEESGRRRPFYLRVSEPLRGKGDYFCRVHAPLLFQNDKEIYGIDEEQAKLLAINFVKSLLGNKRIVDDKGRPVEW